MKAFVFTDEALASEAGRFVWLDLNTELPENASFRTKFQVQALPTYFILDPRTEQVIGRRVGGATVAQLKDFLDAGRATYAATELTPSDLASARAESLYALGNITAAIEAYREALNEASPQWTGYARTVEALLFALQMNDRVKEAAELAADAWPKLRMTAAAGNIAATGLDCTLQLPADDPLRATLLPTMMAAAREVTDSPALPVAADDRSSVFGTLVGAYGDLGDSTAARLTAEAWATYLEGEAAKAKTPEERTVFDSHRMSAYLELGEPARAIPMLEESEHDLPDDYNPPARLAAIYLRLGRLDDALAANDRALDKAYGPRKLRIYQNRADIFTARADTAAARMAIQDALTLAQSFPLGQRSERTIQRLREQLGQR